MTDSIPGPPPGSWERTHDLLRHERELWDAGVDAPEWHTASGKSETRMYRVGDRVRVIDTDAPGIVAEVVGDQQLVIVDLHRRRTGSRHGWRTSSTWTDTIVGQ